MQMLIREELFCATNGWLKEHLKEERNINEEQSSKKLKVGSGENECIQV